MCINDGADVVKQVSSVFVIVEAQSLASLTEGLARKSCTENVVGRNIVRIDGGDVALNLVDAALSLSFHFGEVDDIEFA